MRCSSHRLSQSGCLLACCLNCRANCLGSSVGPTLASTSSEGQQANDGIALQVEGVQRLELRELYGESLDPRAKCKRLQLSRVARRTERTTLHVATPIPILPAITSCRNYVRMTKNDGFLPLNCGRPETRAPSHGFAAQSGPHVPIPHTGALSSWSP